VKPLDEELVLDCAKACGRIVTREEHSVIGGLGEAVCALLSEKLPTPVRRVGVQDTFGCSGPAAKGWSTTALPPRTSSRPSRTCAESPRKREDRKDRRPAMPDGGLWLL